MNIEPSETCGFPIDGFFFKIKLTDYSLKS